MDYVNKRDFHTFHTNLRDSFEIILNLLREAFKRDAKIADNLLQSQFHPSGNAIMVAKAAHLELKAYTKQVIKKGF